MSYLNPYAYSNQQYSPELQAELQAARGTPGPIPTPVSEPITVVPDSSPITVIPEAVESGQSDFVDILSDTPEIASAIMQGDEWFINPIIYAMDGVHYCGASWPIAVMLVAVPIRVAASYYRQQQNNKRTVEMFEQVFVEQMNKMETNLIARVQGTGLAHLGTYMKKEHGFPKQWFESQEFLRFMKERLNISKDAVMKAQQNKFGNFQSKMVFTTALTGLVFFTVGQGTRKLTSMPLEGISNPCLIWSNPAIYDAETVLPVAIGFGSVFALASIIAPIAQMGLKTGARQINVFKVVGFGTISLGGMYGLMLFFKFPGYTQMAFLLACMGNQSLTMFLQSNAWAKKKSGYKTQDDIFQEYRAIIRAHEPYRKLLDAKEAKKNDAEYFKLFAQAGSNAGVGFWNVRQQWEQMKEKLAAAQNRDLEKLVRGDSDKDPEELILDQLYPYEPIKDDKFHADNERRRAEEASVEENLMKDEWTRGVGMAEVPTIEFDEKFLENALENTEQTETKGDYDAIFGKIPEVSSLREVKEAKWERIAERRQLKHKLMEPARGPPKPWWETDTGNHNYRTG